MSDIVGKLEIEIELKDGKFTASLAGAEAKLEAFGKTQAAPNSPINKVNKSFKENAKHSENAGKKSEKASKQMFKGLNDVEKGVSKLKTGSKELLETFLSMFHVYSQLAGAFTTGLSTMSALAVGSTAVAMGLGAIGPAAEGAGGTAVAALSVIPGILAGISGGGIAAALGMQNVSTALSTIMQESQFNQYTTFAQRRSAYTAWHGALANIAPSGQQFLTQLQGMIPLLRNWEHISQSAMFPKLSTALSNLSPVITAIGPEINDAASGMGNFLDKITSFMGGSGFQEMQKIFSSGNGFMGKAGNALTTFFKSEIGLGASGAGQSTLSRLGTWLNHIADAFSKFTSDGGAAKALHDYFYAFDFFAKILHHLWPVIKIVIDTLVKFTGVIAPLIDKLAKGLEPILGKLSVALLKGLAKALPMLVPMILSLAKAFEKLIAGALPIAGRILQILGPIFIQLMGYIGKFAPTLSKLLLMFVNSMGPGLAGIVPLFKQLASSMVELLPTLGKLMAAVTPSFLNALTVLLKVLTPVLNNLLMFFSHFGSKLGPILIVVWGIAKAFKAIEGSVKILEGISKLQKGWSTIAGALKSGGAAEGEAAAAGPGIISMAAAGAIGLAIGVVIGTWLNDHFHISSSIANSILNGRYKLAYSTAQAAIPVKVINFPKEHVRKDSLEGQTQIWQAAVAYAQKQLKYVEGHNRHWVSSSASRGVGGGRRGYWAEDAASYDYKSGVANTSIAYWMAQLAQREGHLGKLQNQQTKIDVDLRFRGGGQLGAALAADMEMTIRRHGG